MSEQLKYQPNYYISFNMNSGALDNNLPLPKETPPEWMKAVLELKKNFKLPLPMISEIEVFQHSKAPEFLTMKFKQYDNLTSSVHSADDIFQFYIETLGEIHQFAADAAINQFGSSQRESELVLLNEESVDDYFIVNAEPPDENIKQLIDLMNQNNITDPIKRARTLSAYHTLEDMGGTLFILLTGTNRMIWQDKTDDIPALETLEKRLFRERPFSFLSTIAYLAATYDSTNKVYRHDNGGDSLSEFQSYLLNEGANPILKAITTIEFSEADPDIDDEYKPYHISHLSQLMAYLSDLYFSERLIEQEITPPFGINALEKKKLLDELAGTQQQDEYDIPHNSYLGLSNALENAGFWEAALTIKLYSRLNKLKVHNTFKSGLRIFLDSHPRIINYLSQLINLNPKATLTNNLLNIYPQLLNEKLNRQEYIKLAKDPNFYLEARNFIKFRFILSDGIGFDDMVQTVIRDIVDDGSSYDKKMSEPWESVILGKLAAREKQATHLKSFLTLFVSKTGLTDVVPFDSQNSEFYQRMLDESPTTVIREQFKKGGRAMVFLQFILKNDQGDIPIEIQMVPESVEADLHNQRDAYLMGRFLGYRGTSDFLQEVTSKDHIDPYVV